MGFSPRAREKLKSTVRSSGCSLADEISCSAEDYSVRGTLISHSKFRSVRGRGTAQLTCVDVFTMPERKNGADARQLLDVADIKLDCFLENSFFALIAIVSINPIAVLLLFPIISALPLPRRPFLSARNLREQ